MSTEIGELIQAAHGGDWSPLLKAASLESERHWAENAQCLGADPEIFSPLSDGPREIPETVRRFQGISLNRPLNFCASCPVAVAARCLVESLRLNDEYGIRAGMLASERSPLRHAWQRRFDEEAVSAVLRGVPVTVNEGERAEVISRLAGDPTLNADHIARGLGIPRKYVWQLVRDHKKSSPPVASASGADVA
ncbi:WhiB family transcriptional regulator [Streptomyces sp. NPDC050610]|uniref:WhiB family transcriptional regulator n=1 Tax=Streptomyces sp. NPDC050610 TaxID=3157097 RepID=UPI00342D8D59